MGEGVGEWDGGDEWGGGDAEATGAGLSGNGLSGVGADSAGLAAVGTQVAERYRLIELVGVDESGPVEFWLARDSVLARQVGATLVAGSSDAERSMWAASMVTALLRWGQFSHPGCPRILDVVGVGHGPDRRGLPDEISVVVVTDWAPGPTLVDFLTGPGTAGSGDDDAGQAHGAEALRAPVEAAAAIGMVAPLAAAADAAHGQGLLLGCDRPELLHIAQVGTRTAHVHLGFLLPDPTRVSGDDVRGLGAVLYALLTGRWPLDGVETSTGQVTTAAGLTDTPPVAPHEMNPAVPTVVSELAMNALGVASSGPGVRTAAALHRAIADLLEERWHYGTGVGQEGPVYGAALSAAGSAEPVGQVSEGAPAAPITGMARRVAGMRHRRFLAAACAVGVLGALGALGVEMVADHVRSVHGGVPTTPASAAAPVPAVNGLPGAATAVSASVYDPSGQPDNPTQVWRALGADPKAGWSTDTYLQPFPALKSGVGIMIGFAGPVQLTSLTVTSPSVGSVLEIRSASSPTNRLGETTEMASTTLQAGETTVGLEHSQPVAHVLVWITKLGGGGDDNVTEISNLRFERAAD